MEFEWDPDKAAANYAKHGIQFDWAIEVFDDDRVLIEEDRDSWGEYRGRATGLSRAGLLFVVFTERYAGLTRIISARRANSYERKAYGSLP